MEFKLPSRGHPSFLSNPAQLEEYLLVPPPSNSAVSGKNDYYWTKLSASVFNLDRGN